MTVPGVGKQAIVLSGGVAYAAYEVGVMKALLGGDSRVTFYRPLKVDIFTGTSAGSFNAAVMASQPGVDSLATAQYLERIWLDLLSSEPETCHDGVIRYRANLAELLNPACLARDPITRLVQLGEDAAFFAQDWFWRAVNFSISRESLARRAFELIDLGTLISLDSFQRILDEVLDLAGIRRSEKVLRIAATNWHTGELKVFSNADMTDSLGALIVRGSSAFPGLPPVEINGDPYVDGGFVTNTPLVSAIEAGADTLHVIYLDPNVINIPLQRLRNTLDTINKLYTINKAALLNRDIAMARHVNAVLESVGKLRAEGALSAEAAEALRQADRVGVTPEPPDRPLRLLTIHRYHPHDDLGGALGLVNFDRDQLADLIDRGYTDAARHDCDESECILPYRAELPKFLTI
jgi:predicted acylesterase/phospholipase RssA